MSKSFLWKQSICISENKIPKKKNKKKKCVFKNLVCAGIFGFMYDFFVYDGKIYGHIMLDDGKFGHLQKCPEVAAKLGNDLRGYKN